MSNARNSRKLAVLALLLHLLPGCATPEAAPLRADIRAIEGGAMEFGQWILGCNNLRVCTALAPLQPTGEAGEVLHVAFTFGNRIADAQTIAVMRGGEMVEGLSPLAAHRLTEDLLRGEDGEAVYLSDQGMRLGVPRRGFAQVMEVLAGWRASPAQKVPAADPVTPLPAARIDRPVVHPALANSADLCPQGHSGNSLQAWQLPGGGILWRAGCGDEGLNSPSFWFVSGPQGAPPVPIRFEDGSGEVQPFNSWFDETTGYLRMTHYFGHWQSYQDDCGIDRLYAWSGGRMALVERRSMPTCGTGIGPEGWISTYRSPAVVLPENW